MAAEDDHGRYRCFECGYGHDFLNGCPIPEAKRIPQVTDFMPEGLDDLPDVVKERIPPMNRLYLTCTKKENDFFNVMMECMRRGVGYYRNPDGSIRPLTYDEQKIEDDAMEKMRHPPEQTDEGK